MALRWLLHSACHVLGHPNQENAITNHENGVVKGPIKVSNNIDGGSSKLSDEREVASGFQMPLHYPRYTKSDYEKMEEWKVDTLLKEYGLMGFNGSLEEKRDFAMGAFLWPRQY